MHATKEGRYLVFYFDDERNSTVKYDLATGTCIGKLGRPVKDIRTQLRGFTIQQVIDMFEDENYRAFLNEVNHSVNRPKHYSRWDRNRTVNKITNVGSFLERIKDYPNLEQYFSAGLRKVSPDIKHKINEVPKGLIKMVRENDFLSLTDILIDSYNINISNINMVNDLYESEETPFYTLSKKDVYRYVFNLSDLSEYVMTRYVRPTGETNQFNTLLVHHGYSAKTLLKYIDYLLTFEALNSSSYILNELSDYVRMMSRISPKYEKCPKNFLTTHQIAVRNYNRLKETFDEQDFQDIRNRNADNMEWQYGDYVFLYPREVQDIKDEAVQQHNCVASYIRKVLRGDCHIMFMRNKKSKDKSLVTLEINPNTNVICQAFQKFNQVLNSNQREAVEEWNKHYARVLKRKENSVA